MRFTNTEVFNIEGAMRGMRFAMKGKSTTLGDVIADKDYDLAKRLWAASEKENLAHSKFLRQILLSVDISAPLYWWSEADTYKIGTTANSESTMHKLRTDARDLDVLDFEYDSYFEFNWLKTNVIPQLKFISSIDLEDSPFDTENDRLTTLKRCLPTSYIQKRHWTANYEVVRNMYNQRKNHRLNEWSKDFCGWAKSLPYSEFITGEFK